ncbi:hypothetical protein ACFV0R_02800 [Streptomyces sp. NPDC059578]|uniref:hypothetical protein n=1 Tax=unclassified Streptomyces TaxID=2593676 RepID=UPI0036629A36
MRKRLLRRVEPRALPGVLLAASGAVAVGVATGHLIGSRALTEASWYPLLAGLLLALGLYGSTHEIDLREVRRDLRALVLTVTLGVLLKSALIAGVMVAAFQEPEYLVLGIAVAQIDPLSVAAMSRSSRMSPRAKNLLSVWASFDDPVTVLLTLYFSVLAFRLSGRSGSPGTGPVGDGAGAYAASLGGNLLLLAAAVGLWYLPGLLWRRALDRARARSGRPPAPKGRATPAPFPGLPGLRDLLCLFLVTAVLVVAAQTMLMLAVAVLGLVVRTGRHTALINHAVSVAFVLAALVLGLLLAGGVSPWRGLALGLAAFAAQALIGLLVAPLLFRGLNRSDRVHLGLGQQNGITAIILALALEPDFPGTVAIVGPAILTINTLHYASNRGWHAHRDRVDRRAPHGPPPEHQRTARPGTDDEPLEHPTGPPPSDPADPHRTRVVHRSATDGHGTDRTVTPAPPDPPAPTLPASDTARP